MMEIFPLWMHWTKKETWSVTIRNGLTPHMSWKTTKLNLVESHHAFVDKDTPVRSIIIRETDADLQSASNIGISDIKFLSLLIQMMITMISSQLHTLSECQTRRRVGRSNWMWKWRCVSVLSHSHRTTVSPWNLQIHQMPRYAIELLLPSRSFLCFCSRWMRNWKRASSFCKFTCSGLF